MSDTITSLDTPAAKHGLQILAERNRSKLLDATRDLMAAGDFRPPIDRIAVKADLSVRCAYVHLENAAKAWEAALDEPTRSAILQRLMPNGPWPSSEDCSRIVRAAVWGRLSL